MLGLFSSLGKFAKGGSSTRKDVGSGIDNAKKKTISAKSFFKKSSGNDAGDGGSSAIVLRPSSILSTKTIKTSSFLGKETAVDAKPETDQDQKKTFEDILNELSLIKGSLTKINGTISSNLAARSEQLKSNLVSKSKKKSKIREDELEKKKKTAAPGVAAIAKPGMSFFDMILNYFTNVFLGSLAVFALSKLPQIISAFTTIGKNLSNTFNVIKASVISLTTNFPKQIKSLAKLFQKVVTSKPARAIGQLLASAGKAVANIFGKASKSIFNIIKGPLKNLLGKVTSGALGGVAKGIGSIGKIGGKNAAAGALKLGLLTKDGFKHFSRIGSIFKRIPFVGALIGIGIDLALGTPPDAAVAGAIGASLGAGIGGAIGTGVLPIPGVGTFLGGVVGAAVGDWAGKEIYKNLKGNFSSILPQQNAGTIQKKAEGGETTRATGVEKRQLRKIIIDKPIRRPGRAQPLSKSTEDDAKKYFFRGDKSLGRFKRISKSYSDMRFVGNILKLGIDIGMGEKPNQNNINVAADSLAYSVAMAIKKEELELPGVNKNTSGTIANSLSSWARKEIFREIMNKRGDLAIRSEDRKDEGGGLIPGEGDFLPGSVPGGQLTMEQLVGLAKGAGFSDSDAVIMAAIAKAESGGNSNARNFKPPDKSYGLWQINMIGSLGPARLKEFGISSEDQLFDPVTNAKAAFSVKKSSGFDAWTVHKTGKYKDFLQQAQAAKGAPSLRVSPIASTSGPAAMVTGGLKASQIAQTSAQGWRWGKMHRGIDMDGGDGSPISSAQNATVVHSGFLNDGYGYSVILKYSNGAETRFGHLQSTNVKTGQQIRAGQVLGKQGNTGASRGSHLHFEYYPSGNAMSYEGYGNASAVKDSYIRYGGNVTPILTDKPMDTAGSRFLGGFISKDGKYFLHKGEYVIDKDSVDTFGLSFIDSINRVENKSQLKKSANALINTLKQYSDDESDSVVFLPLPQKQSPEVSAGGSGGVQIIPIETGVNNRITYDTVFQSALYKV